MPAKLPRTQLTSYTRTFLGLVSKRNPSKRFVKHAFAAARKRWPSGTVVREGSSICFKLNGLYALNYDTSPCIMRAVWEI